MAALRSDGPFPILPPDGRARPFLRRPVPLARRRRLAGRGVHFAIYIAVAVVSIGIAWLPTAWAGFLSGIVYAAIGPAMAIHGTIREQRRPSAEAPADAPG